MNTAEIISKCRDLPGVTVREGEGRTYIAKMQLPAELLDRLMHSGDFREPDGITMKTGVIDFLGLLLYGQTPAETEPRVYYTKSQVEIARQTEKLLSADLSKQHTVREFAELFSVSESSVKNYFYGVFGQSISKYLTHRRMLRAAELLKTTDCSVLEVANRVGYLNQSKFAAAFRREHAVTPLEYRRKVRL